MLIVIVVFCYVAVLLVGWCFVWFALLFVVWGLVLMLRRLIVLFVISGFFSCWQV